MAGTLNAATKAARDNKYAIIVGINSYTNKAVNPLNFAVNDAYAIKGLLVKKMGFDEDNIYVFTSEKHGESEPTLTNILFALDSIRQDVSPGGTFLFFFSGHGLHMEGESFLLTREADPRSRLTLEASSLKVSKVMDTIAKMKADKIVLLIDACRTDPGGNKGDKRNTMSREFSKDLVIKAGAQEQQETVKARATFYSCSEGESSFEWQDKKQGFFSYYLVQGIGGEAADSNGNVTLSSLESYLSSKVPKTTMKWMRQNQTPWMEASGSGMSKWALTKGKPGSVTDAKASQSGRQEMAAREEAKQYFARGDECYDKKDYENAIAEYTRAIEKDPDYVEAYNHRGNAYIEKRDYDKAIEEYTRALEIKPDFETAYINRALAYAGKKDYERAIADCTKAIELNPNDADSYVHRGYVHQEKNDLDSAILDFSKAIAIEPKNEEAYFRRGSAYFDKRDNDRALADFVICIEIKPDSGRAYYGRGRVYVRKDDSERAIADFTKAIAINPNDAEAYFYRGLAYDHEKDFEMTIADYTKAIAINPNYAEAYLIRAGVYFEKEDYGRAIADYTKAIEIDPNYASAYYMRGLSYNIIRDFSRSISDLRAFLRLAPSGSVKQINYASDLINKMEGR